MDRQEALKKIDELKAFVEELDKHKEPVLVHCMQDNGKWCSGWGGKGWNWKQQRSSLTRHRTLTWKQTPFDVITIDGGGCKTIWLGYWNDGPKEDA